ncbi:cilia- and flagella-associated protein 161-like [Antedon mediterranea]|uniref:cilia- and flagella-associated protein 161-like n=1 Tax=Antedon mediterranea TaxID=105859 RepID=UPI003AF8D5EE
MSVRTYNPSVRVGNWSEDICLEEDTLKDHLEKRERGELLIQKSSRLSETILKPVELSVTSDGLLHFGDVVMVMNEAPRLQVATSFGDMPQTSSALSVNMAESKIHEALNFEGNCSVSASKLLQPCARNAFVISQVKGANIPTGSPLVYNQHFYLRTLPGVGGDLIMKSDIATFQSSAKKSRKQLLEFSEDDSSYIGEWRILCFNPQLRMETEGLPVQANQKIIFNHCKTNQDLCVISNKIVRTAFGVDYEAVAYTDLDSHKAEKPNNHWIMVTGSPSEPRTPAQILKVGETQ